MGLSKGEETRPEAAPVLAWLLPGVLAALALTLILAGEAGNEWLRFDRAGIRNGEVWRLVTGHIVHLGPSHAILNVAGLVLVWILVGREFSNSRWLWILAASVASINLGLWFLKPNLDWYVGLSGLLHGMLAAGVVSGFRERSLEAAVISLIVIGKLAFEQLVGPLPGSESTSGGAVVVDAHLYGVVGGTIMAVALIRVRRRAPI